MTADDQQQSLRDAIARKAGAVLSLPTESGPLRHHKTRLLAAQDEGFWIQCPQQENELIEAMMSSGRSVGLSLKASSIKMVLATMILQFRAGKTTPRGTTCDALLLAWPSQLKAIQRRADFRVTVYPGTGVSVRAWRIPDHHYLRERPPSTALIEVRLCNLSLGGMGAIYTPASQALPLDPDQRLRIIINHPKGELLIDGRVKHTRRHADGELTLGIQFRKLEDAIEGRQTRAALTQIIGDLQRDGLRRAQNTTEDQTAVPTRAAQVSVAV